MTDKTDVLIPRASDCILCVKVGKVRRESLYEMTRKYWKVSLGRASRATQRVQRDRYTVLANKYEENQYQRNESLK